MDPLLWKGKRSFISGIFSTNFVFSLIHMQMIPSRCLFVIDINFTSAILPCCCSSFKQLGCFREWFDRPLNNSGHLSNEGQTREGGKNLIRLNDDWNGLIYIFCMHTLHTWSLLSTGSSGQKSTICMRWTHLYANSLACRPASFLPFRTVYLLGLIDAKGIGILKPKKLGIQSISSTSPVIMFILKWHSCPLFKL